MKRINGYRGDTDVSEVSAAFASDAVRDALPSAPQPVSKPWVSFGLAVCGHFGTWAENHGIPVTRDHLLTRAIGSRGSKTPEAKARLSKISRRNYRLKLDGIAACLAGLARMPTDRRPRNPVGYPSPLEALTLEQEAALWWWTHGLGPITVRDRLQGVFLLGVGVGARRGGMVHVRAQDVSRDHHGVHVAFPPTTRLGNSPSYPARVVTCDPTWEERLWAFAQSVKPDYYLVAPWRNTSPSPHTMDNTLRNAINDKFPPVDFSTETLRNTWLVRHLERGTRVDVLLAQAGLISLVTLDKLRVYLPEPSEHEIRIWMRDGHRP